MHLKDVVINHDFDTSAASSGDMKLLRTPATITMTVEFESRDELTIGGRYWLGWDLPPVPGFSGAYFLDAFETTQTLDGQVEATLELRPDGTLDIHPSQRDDEIALPAGDYDQFEAILARDHGAAPDYAAIWDELSFLAPAPRAAAMAEVQSRQRDRMKAAERNQRIDERAETEYQREKARDELERSSTNAAVRAQVERRQAEAAAERERQQREARAREWGLDDRPRQINLEDE